MRSFALVLVAIIAFFAGSPFVAEAQSGFGQGGGSGGGGFGGGSGGSSSGFGGGSSGFGGGSSGFGGGGGGFGGQSGAGGFGQGSALGGALGGAGGFGQSGMAGGANGQQQGQNFLGRTANPNQFLGRTTQGATGQMGNQGQTGANRGRAANRGGLQQNNLANQQMNGQNGGGGNANQLPPIRPRLTVGFDYPKIQTSNISGKLETRLTKRKGMQDIKISAEPSGELVLKGQVASVDLAKMAENMLRIEPGVQNVRNELTYPEVKSEE